DFFDGSLDRLRDRLHTEGITKHHGYGSDGAYRIGAIATGNVGRRSVHRLVERGMLAEAGGRQQTDRAREHGGFVAQDVAEHVVGQDDVETRRPVDQPHRATVHIEVV